MKLDQHPPIQKIVVKNSEINKGTTFQIVLDKIS